MITSLGVLWINLPYNGQARLQLRMLISKDLGFYHPAGKSWVAKVPEVQVAVNLSLKGCHILQMQHDQQLNRVDNLQVELHLSLRRTLIMCRI